jgi:hypothetical protein
MGRDRRRSRDDGHRTAGWRSCGRPSSAEPAGAQPARLSRVTARSLAPVGRTCGQNPSGDFTLAPAQSEMDQSIHHVRRFARLQELPKATPSLLSHPRAAEQFTAGLVGIDVGRLRGHERGRAGDEQKAQQGSERRPRSPVRADPARSRHVAGLRLSLDLPRVGLAPDGVDGRDNVSV